jgi:Mannosyltransferase (PIG-V)
LTTTLSDLRERVRVPSPVGRPSLPVTRRRTLHRPVLVYLASRVLVFATVAIVTIAGSTDPGKGPWPTLPGPRVPFLRALGRWDSAWYLAIVRHGYRVESSPPRGHASDAFFPLYPMLVRGISDVTHLSPLIVAVILTTLFGGAAAVFVWLLAKRLAGERVADRAAILFCFFPGAFALSMAYSEALLVLACAVSLFALVERRWVLAGVAAAVATATRPNAAAIILACAVAAFLAWRHERDLRAWIAPLLAPLGGLAYFTFQWRRTGDFMAWFHAERNNWQDHLDPGITGFHRIWQTFTGPLPSLHAGGLNIQVVAFGTVLAVIGIVFLLRWCPSLPVMLFGLGVVAMACASVNVGPRPRLLLPAFPVAIAVARGVRGKTFVAIAVVSALAMAVLTGITVASLAATP